MRNKIRPMQLAPVSSGAAARIRLALLLTATVLVVEVVGGLWAHSLALLSDAGHVVTDLVVLALSAFALRQVQRPATARRTFGYQRVGILVALVNALLLGAIVVGIIIEAVRRLQDPGEVRGGLMAAAAVVGLLISLLIARSLQPLQRDLTIKSALMHIWGDAWASAGIIVAGLVIAATNWLAIDPLLSIAIAALIAWSAWRVLSAAIDILMESTPPDLQPDSVVTAVKRVPGVRDLHDLHIWSLGAQRRAMSAHLLIDDQSVTQARDILAEVREVLAHEFEIEHTTIQFESLVCRPGDVFCVQPEGHPHTDDAHDRMTRRAAGGDGTLAEVMAAAHERGIPMGSCRWGPRTSSPASWGSRRAGAGRRSERWNTFPPRARSTSPGSTTATWRWRPASVSTPWSCATRRRCSSTGWVAPPTSWPGPGGCRARRCSNARSEPTARKRGSPRWSCWW